MATTRSGLTGLVTIHPANTASTNAAMLVPLASRWKPQARLTNPEPNAAQPPQKLIIRSAVPCSSTRSDDRHRARHQRAAGDQPDVPAETEQEQADEDQRAVVAGQHRAGRAGREHDAGDHHRPIGMNTLDEPADPRRQPVHAGDVHRDDVRRRTRPDGGRACAAASSSSPPPSPSAR